MMRLRAGRVDLSFSNCPGGLSASGCPQLRCCFPSWSTPSVAASMSFLRSPFSASLSCCSLLPAWWIGSASGVPSLVRSENCFPGRSFFPRSSSPSPMVCPPSPQWLHLSAFGGHTFGCMAPTTSSAMPFSSSW